MKRYQWLGDSLRHKPLEYVMDYAAIDYKDWFTFTTGKEPQRDEPLSRLSARQLLFRKKVLVKTSLLWKHLFFVLNLYLQPMSLYHSGQLPPERILSIRFFIRTCK